MPRCRSAPGWVTSSRLLLEDCGKSLRYKAASALSVANWMLSAGADPAFIASQMGCENAKMVYEVYSTWIVGMNADQVGMLNERL